MIVMEKHEDCHFDNLQNFICGWGNDIRRIAMPLRPTEVQNKGKKGMRMKMVLHERYHMSVLEVNEGKASDLRCNGSRREPRQGSA